MTPHRYLYPFRRRVELCSALYAGGFGVWVWAWVLHGARDPIGWSGLGTAAQLTLAQALVYASFVHALGVKINGNWRWSPALRMAGMLVHVGIFAWLGFQAALGSSAGWTYLWISGAIGVGAYSAARDLGHAVGWLEWKPH